MAEERASEGPWKASRCHREMCACCMLLPAAHWCKAEAAIASRVSERVSARMTSETRRHWTAAVTAVGEAGTAAARVSGTARTASDPRRDEAPPGKRIALEKQAEHAVAAAALEAAAVVVPVAAVVAAASVAAGRAPGKAGWECRLRWKMRGAQRASSSERSKRRDDPPQSQEHQRQPAQSIRLVRAMCTLFARRWTCASTMVVH